MYVSLNSPPVPEPPNSGFCPPPNMGVGDCPGSLPLVFVLELGQSVFENGALA